MDTPENTEQGGFDLAGSRIQGISWPAFPSRAAANRLALQFQLEHSQWWSPDAIRTRQLRQLNLLLRFASEQVPFYRESFAALGIDARQAMSWDSFQRLPVLTRAEVQCSADRLLAAEVPPNHGGPRVVSSSGSTGRPVTIKKTALCNFFWEAFALRFHLWHQHDFSGTFAAIRYADHEQAVPPRGARMQSWGPETLNVIRTGPSWLLRSSTDIDDQVEWLQRVEPHYLLTYPSNLLQLARHFISKKGALPKLRQVCTVGEALPAGVREACREAWNVELADVYSSEEAGCLAIQCPAAEHHHVQAEGVLVEILDANNDPCAPGQTGRVVITPLHNFTQPLIRYELGDYAEVGGSCPCGRGLPVLNRIVGRTRNMARLPDGRLFRPSVGITDFAAVAPVRQAQLVQRDLDHIDIRLVVDRALGQDRERRIAAIVQKNFDYPMRVTFTYVSTIPRSARDKFEDFLSELD